MIHDGRVSKGGRKEAKVIPSFLAWVVRVSVVLFNERCDTIASLRGNWGWGERRCWVHFLYMW